jgi:integrase/recombinase XerC
MGGELLLNEYRLHMQRRGMLDSSIACRLARLRSVERAVGSLVELDTEQIEQFLDRRNIGARTRYGWLSHLHCFYTWAFDRHYIDEDPTRTIIRPRLRRTLPRPIHDRDLMTAIQLAPSGLRAMLLLAAFSGLRCAEIARLERGDVLESWEPPMLRIRGKGDIERMVPLHPDVWASLRLAGLPHTGRVFRRPRGGGWSPALLSRHVAVYFDDIGIDATAHQLRHWFATRTYAASLDLRVTQELLGHASPTTTAIYTQFSQPAAAEAVFALNLGGTR